MFHAALKSTPWTFLCGTKRPQNGINTTSIKMFMTLPVADRCKNCEKLIAKIQARRPVQQAPSIVSVPLSYTGDTSNTAIVMNETYGL